MSLSRCAFVALVLAVQLASIAALADGGAGPAVTPVPEPTAALAFLGGALVVRRWLRRR